MLINYAAAVDNRGRCCNISRRAIRSQGSIAACRQALIYTPCPERKRSYFVHNFDKCQLASATNDSRFIFTKYTIADLNDLKH